MTRRTLLAAALALFLAASFVAIPASAAADLMTVKAQGLVGEQPDGLLGLVNPAAAPADVASMVSTINAERMGKYQAIAAKNGTPVAQTQALAGEKLMGQTPAGQFVKAPDGSWLRK